MQVSKNNQAHKDKHDFRSTNQQKTLSVGIQFFSAFVAELEAWKLHIQDFLPAGIFLGCSKGKQHWWEIKREWERAEEANIAAGELRASAAMPPAANSPPWTLLAPLQSNTSLNPSLLETSQCSLFSWLDMDQYPLKTSRCQNYCTRMIKLSLLCWKK